MTRQQFADLNKAAELGTISDDLNPAFIFSLTSNDLLSQIANGKIDCKELAKRILEARGRDNSGNWVGFKAEAYDRKGRRRRVSIPKPDRL